jgi:GTP-dependent phosphoenolpyruvate carboxykinase
MKRLLSFDLKGWQAELPLIKEHLARFGSHLPDGLQKEVADLERRLKA